MEKVQILKALSDETRYQILNLLLTHDYCVGALSDNLGISKAAVSQHLGVLKKAGLVKGEKRGYWTHYAVVREPLLQLAEELQQMSRQSPGSAFTCSEPSAESVKKCREKMCHEKCHGEGKKYSCGKVENNQ
ncbi:MAG: winged helix-turn-helix transcriptional regulator [Firmicutes bacterium]|nr:winged helix-turn-helix transcriptional regulator [Bacillota bacterium]